MPQFTAIGLGEILWDVLPDGRKLGGAPANFAYHVNQLGGIGIPVSRVGSDDLGREALDILRSNGIDTSYVSIDPVHPTGTVDAAIDEHGVATYTFPESVAWDYIVSDTAALELVASADVICFGTLAQRASVARKSVRACLRAASAALKVYDINLRQNFYTPDRIHNSLSMADVLKINDEELAMVIGMFDLPHGERMALDELIERYNLKLAVLTRGSEGALILSPSDISDLPGQPTPVVDTIGAGDSFTAALALAYLYGRSLEEINRYAMRVAAYVCGQAGAMPPMPDELRLG